MLTTEDGKDFCALGVLPKLQPPYSIKALANVGLHSLFVSTQSARRVFAC